MSRPEQSGPADLQLLIDSIPALIHTSQPDGYLDYFNQRWQEYIGVPLEEIEGWKWTAAVHREDVDAIVKKWQACLVSGEVFEHECRVRRADGKYRGKKRIPSEIAVHLAEHYSDEPLTDREVEILRQLGGGNRNRDIAEKLFIAEETVKVHIKHIMAKLGASDRTQAVAIAVRRGIINL